MAFFSEVRNKLGLDVVKAATGYSYINFNGEAVYVEGIKRLENVKEDEIIVNVGKKLLVVFGDALEISELDVSCIIIKGRIKSVSVEV